MYAKRHVAVAALYRYGVDANENLWLRKYSRSSCISQMGRQLQLAIRQV
jgi:hypothetical protein